jgi:hypothetical protein
LGWWSHSPAAASSSILATAKARVEDVRLEELPGEAVKLLRALAGSGVRWSGGSVVAHGFYAAEQSGATARASMAAVGFRVRV